MFISCKLCLAISPDMEILGIRTADRQYPIPVGYNRPTCHNIHSRLPVNIHTHHVCPPHSHSFSPAHTKAISRSDCCATRSGCLSPSPSRKINQSETRASIARGRVVAKYEFCTRAREDAAVGREKESGIYLTSFDGILILPLTGCCGSYFVATLHNTRS